MHHLSRTNAVHLGGCRRMSSKHHPDKVQDDELRHESRLRFEAIREAGKYLAMASML